VTDPQVKMTDSEVLKVVGEIVNPHSLRAEFLGGEDVKSVGVGGDSRSYTRVIVLIGPHPGDEILASVATEISNRTGINRVTFELARKRSEL